MSSLLMVLSKLIVFLYCDFLCFIPSWILLTLSNLWICTFHQFWNILKHYFFKYSFHFSSSLWNFNYSYAKSVNIVPQITKTLVFSDFFLFMLHIVSTPIFLLHSLRLKMPTRTVQYANKRNRGCRWLWGDSSGGRPHT